MNDTNMSVSQLVKDIGIVDGGCHAPIRFGVMLICVEDARFPTLDGIHVKLLLCKSSRWSFCKRLMSLAAHRELSEQETTRSRAAA